METLRPHWLANVAQEDQMDLNDHQKKKQDIMMHKQAKAFK